MIITTDIEKILQATYTPETDVSISLDNQRVLIEGQDCPVKRKIFHVKFDDFDHLTGSMLVSRGDRYSWLPYIYDFNKEMWRPVDIGGIV